MGNNDFATIMNLTELLSAQIEFKLTSIVIHDKTEQDQMNVDL